MGEDIMELPRYKSHKTVWALKIKSIEQSKPYQVVEGGSYEIIPEDERYGPITVATAYIEKHLPKPGGYYVRYKDGYESFSPADVFEEGNTLETPASPSPYAPHQQRIVEEKASLDEKVTKLAAFIGGNIFPKLSDDERSRLSIQLQHMNGYSEILSQRIAAF